jgi:flagellar biosynthesis/type III secretory pathway chaperone
MTEKLKILGNEDLVRDTKSNAILNTDLDALNKYRAKRAREKKINNIAEEVDTLRQEMTEIKSLLMQLVQREKNK